MRAVAGHGRLAWRISGVATAAALAIPGIWLLAHAGSPVLQAHQSISVSTSGRFRTPTATQQVTITQPVTSLDVRSYGGPIQIKAGSGGHDVTVAEAMTYSGHRPAVTATVSHGELTLDAPACASAACGVGFTVTVPARVTVTAVSDGGAIMIGDTAAADLTSGGGPVEAANVDGPLQASTDGGSLTVVNLTGSLQADTGSGPVFAAGVTAATATIATGGGAVRLWFATAPDSVRVTTGGGPAYLSVPGGPYALTTDSGGGPQSVDLATDPSAARTLSVSTSGGALQIGPQGAVSLPSAPLAPPLPQ
jgi:hypothetical protein